MDTWDAPLTSDRTVATAYGRATRVSESFYAAALSELNKLLALVQEPSWNHTRPETSKSTASKGLPHGSNMPEAWLPAARLLPVYFAQTLGLFVAHVATVH